MFVWNMIMQKSKKQTISKRRLSIQVVVFLNIFTQISYVSSYTTVATWSCKEKNVLNIIWQNEINMKNFTINHFWWKKTRKTKIINFGSRFNNSVQKTSNIYLWLKVCHIFCEIKFHVNITTTSNRYQIKSPIANRIHLQPKKHSDFPNVD